MPFSLPSARTSNPVGLDLQSVYCFSCLFTRSKKAAYVNRLNPKEQAGILSPHPRPNGYHKAEMLCLIDCSLIMYKETHKGYNEHVPNDSTFAPRVQMTLGIGNRLADMIVGMSLPVSQPR